MVFKILTYPLLPVSSACFSACCWPCRIRYLQQLTAVEKTSKTFLVFAINKNKPPHLIKKDWINNVVTKRFCDNGLTCCKVKCHFNMPSTIRGRIILNLHCYCNRLFTFVIQLGSMYEHYHLNQDCSNY